MPYEWTPDPNSTPTAAGYQLELRAHNSLTPRGFVWFFAITAGFMLIPLVAFIGTAMMWIILAYIATAFALTWLALKRSWRRGQVHERFTLAPTLATLVRTNPDGTTQDWQENPYWIQIRRIKTDGPVPDYITLSGHGRTVEIGAFLSQDERQTLYHDLHLALSQINQTAP